jgi:DNA-binding response OmpR family regulator
VRPKIDGREKADVLAVGALDYVELPFDTREMIARIRRVIGRASI